ncbi:MAG: CoA pyrophosphatase [Alphaproteobacteria bacterium]
MTRDLVIARLKAGARQEPRLRRGVTVRRRGDHDMNGDDMRHPGPLRPAAVLIPLVDRGEGMTVLLTERTAHLTDHAGQVSFPGGRIEPEDVSAEAAALREAFEEVGLLPSVVEPVGRLDDYETRTGFLVHPIVAIVTPPFAVKPDPAEVADIFEVPLAFILDRRNHRRESRLYKGRERQFYVLPYEGRYIWGATASMLVNLTEVLVD